MFAWPADVPINVLYVPWDGLLTDPAPLPTKVLATPIPVWLIDPLTVREPDIVWLASNWLDPVVANEPVRAFNELVDTNEPVVVINELVVSFCWSKPSR